MSKPTFFIRIAICLLSLPVLLLGCQGKSDDVEKTSSVVSQKISANMQKAVPQEPEAKTDSPVEVPSTPPSVDTHEGSAETETTATSPVKTFDTQTLIPDLTLGYDSQGRIDPFIPLVRDEPVVVEKEGEGPVDAAKKGHLPERTKTPLEKIELSQLKLRAIILAPSGNKALVEESTGKGYIISNGTYIGRHDGKVVNILKDKVVIEELIEDFEGKLTPKEKEIKLPKPPGEE